MPHYSVLNVHAQDVTALSAREISVDASPVLCSLSSNKQPGTATRSVQAANHGSNYAVGPMLATRLSAEHERDPYIVETCHSPCDPHFPPSTLLFTRCHFSCEGCLGLHSLVLCRGKVEHCVYQSRACA